MKRNLKGQNLVEYILMAVAVIVVLLVVLNPRSGPMKNSVENTLNSTLNMIDKINSEIQFRPPPP